jgi:Ca-activated chloride channel family protein
MKLALDNLYPNDTFNLITFAGDTNILFDKPVPATPENLAKAQKFLASREGGGGTEMMKAIRAALEPSDAQDHVRIVCFMTDGYVGNDLEILGEIQKHPNARVFSFGIGSSVNRHLIEGLARVGQGEPFVVTDPGQADATSERFLAYVGAPLLAHPAVTFDGFDVYDVEPLVLPDLLAERPLIVLGKWRGRLGGTVRVQGIAGAGPYQAEYDVAAGASLPDGEGLARLWARRRIAAVSDLNELRPTEEAKSLVTGLGLKYNLLTRYTSFVAVDQPIRRVGPSLETIKQPLALPAGVENSAVGGGAVAAAPEPSEIGLIAVAVGFLLIAFRWKKKRPKPGEAEGV